MNTLSYKTISANKATVKKAWLLLDADGASLGRIASETAKLIMGKHKTCFTPNVDCGDHVIVINAGKVTLTGNKWEDKIYYSHSGYPGGQKKTSAKKLFAKTPSALIEKAVKGMIPKNKLGRKIFKNLHVYAGAEHSHAAQNPIMMQKTLKQKSN